MHKFTHFKPQALAEKLTCFSVWTFTALACTNSRLYFVRISERVRQARIKSWLNNYSVREQGKGSDSGCSTLHDLKAFKCWHSSGPRHPHSVVHGWWFETENISHVRTSQINFPFYYKTSLCCLGIWRVVGKFVQALFHHQSPNLGVASVLSAT